MDQREIMEQVQKLRSDNPARFIKIRDIFDAVFNDRTIGSEKAISDREFEQIREKFRGIDAPLSWCIDKETVYQLYKAVSYHRTPSRSKRDEPSTANKSSKSKKKGLFGFLG